MTQIIFGRNPVQEWLMAELPVRKVMLAKDVRGLAVRFVEQLAEQRNITIKRLPRQGLSKFVGHDGHQGVAAEIDIPAYLEIDDILKIAETRQEPPLIGILDGIQDPQNLGAILRSADGAGMHGIIIPKDKAAGLGPTVLKVSAGAAVHVPIAQVTNLARSIDELKERGVWIVGTDMDAKDKYTETDFAKATGIVLGSEGKGMRRLVRDKCDFLVSIPMFGKINSLNVSVSAGLLFFQARNQRCSVTDTAVEG